MVEWLGFPHTRALDGSPSGATWLGRIERLNSPHPSPLPAGEGVSSAERLQRRMASVPGRALLVYVGEI
jgi:hypothetical protein